MQPLYSYINKITEINVCMYFELKKTIFQKVFKSKQLNSELMFLLVIKNLRKISERSFKKLQTILKR